MKLELGAGGTKGTLDRWMVGFEVAQIWLDLVKCFPNKEGDASAHGSGGSRRGQLYHGAPQRRRGDAVVAINKNGWLQSPFQVAFSVAE